MKRFNIGKLVNYRSMDDAIAAGQRSLDLGAGDSGYKSEMGATEGYELVDLLFVRHRPAALVMARMWGEEMVPAPQVELPQRMRAHG